MPIRRTTGESGDRIGDRTIGGAPRNVRRDRAGARSVSSSLLNANVARTTRQLGRIGQKPDATPRYSIAGLDALNRPLARAGSADLVPVNLTNTARLDPTADNLNNRYLSLLPGQRILTNADTNSSGTGLPVGMPSLENSGGDLSVFRGQGSTEPLTSEEQFDEWQSRSSSGIGVDPTTSINPCLNGTVVRPGPEEKDEDEEDEQDNANNPPIVPPSDGINPIPTPSEDPCQGGPSNCFWVTEQYPEVPAGVTFHGTVQFEFDTDTVYYLYCADDTADTSDGIGCDWQNRQPPLPADGGDYGIQGQPLRVRIFNAGGGIILPDELPYGVITNMRIAEFETGLYGPSKGWQYDAFDINGNAQSFGATPDGATDRYWPADSQDYTIEVYDRDTFEKLDPIPPEEGGE